MLHVRCFCSQGTTDTHYFGEIGPTRLEVIFNYMYKIGLNHIDD